MSRCSRRSITSGAGSTANPCREMAFNHGANWIHGAGKNPIWELNQQENILQTQWLPQSYHATFRSGRTRQYYGNSSTVPGDDMRSDFSAFMWQHESFIKWTKEIANSTKPPLHPDLPQNYFLDEYAARHNLTGDALDELLLFYSSTPRSMQRRIWPTQGPRTMSGGSTSRTKSGRSPRPTATRTSHGGWLVVSLVCGWLTSWKGLNIAPRVSRLASVAAVSLPPGWPWSPSH
jgi:hypothetical protein